MPNRTRSGTARSCARHAPLPRPVAFAVLAVVALSVSAAAALLLTGDGWAVNRLNVRIWAWVTGPLGLQGTVSPARFAAVANILLFVPMFAALAMLRPTWLWLLSGVVVSTAVEVYQGPLGTRIQDPWDIVANTIGTAAGIGLGLLIRRLVVRGGAGEPTIPVAPHDCSDGVRGEGRDDRD